MDKQLELIWKYIDGELNTAEKLDIQRMLNADPQLDSLYRAQLKLHKSLSESNLVEAPQGFASRVMANLPVAKVQALRKYDSFTGIKGILIWALGFTLLAIIAIALYPPIVASGTEAVYSFDKYIPEEIQNISLSGDIIRYASYATFLLVAPILLYVDNLFSKRSVIR